MCEMNSERQRPNKAAAEGLKTIWQGIKEEKCVAGVGLVMKKTVRGMCTTPS